MLARSIVRKTPSAGQNSTSTSKLAEFVNSMSMRANYQPVIVKALLEKVDHCMTRTEAAEILAAANNSKDIAFFRTVPVFEVLQKHGIIGYDAESKVISLKVMPKSHDERTELIKQCEKKIKEFKA